MTLERGKRERLPGRRKAITQKATITGHDGVGTFYITFGEFQDKRLAEIFINAYKVGTFSQGVLDALARTISIAIQFGTPPEAIVKALRNLNFPPRGMVEGSEKVEFAHSVCDWIAQEIEQWYVEEDKRRPRSTMLTAPKPDSVSLHPQQEITSGDTIIDSNTKTVIESIESGHKSDGSSCVKCGSNRMIRAGACLTCADCGESGGCS